MSVQYTITYKTPQGQIKQSGTGPSGVNSTTTYLQNQGNTIIKVEAIGTEKQGSAPQAPIKITSREVIYERGTEIGKELEQPTESQPQHVIQLQRGESYDSKTGIIIPEQKSATGVLPIPIKGQPDTRLQERAYGIVQQNIQLQIYMNKQQQQMISSAPSNAIFTDQTGNQLTREQALQQINANEANLNANLSNISSYQKQGYDISQPKPGEYSFILTPEKQQQMQLEAINAENEMLKKLPGGELIIAGKRMLSYGLHAPEYLYGLTSMKSPTGGIAIGYEPGKLEAIQKDITIKGQDIFTSLIKKDYGSAALKIATSPTVTDIVLPFAFAGGLSLAFKGVGLAAGTAVSKAAIGSSSIITKAAAITLPPFAKAAPWVVGTTFTSMAGAQVGMTAAYEQKGLIPKGSTALTFEKLGVQFGSASIGATMAMRSNVFASQLKSQEITSITKGIRNPKEPTDVLFLSKAKMQGKNIFSFVEARPIDIGLKGNLGKVIATGKTTILGTSRTIDLLASGKTEPIYISSGLRYEPIYKFGKGIVFKEQPIFGVSKGKYMFDIRDFMVTRYTGIALGKGKTIFSKGASLAKTLYEGETIIKGGFLSQRKGTIELIKSMGEFKGKTTKGVFGDITKIVTPKIKGKDYFGADMSAMGGDFTKVITKLDITSILPGGLVGPKILEGPPLLIAPMYPQRTIKLFEEDVSYASSHWIGIKPSISERISIVSPTIKLNSEINLAKASVISSILNTGIVSKVEARQDILQANITKQLLNQIQLPATIQELKQQSIQELQQKQIQIQLNQQVNIQVQRQLQNQLQQQIQIQDQLQLQELTQQLIQLQEIITIPGIIDITPPGEVGEYQQPGNSFYVKVKNKQYEHGKKVYPTSYSRATQEPYTQQDAMALGADITGKTAKATFILEPSDKAPVKLRKNVEPWNKVKNQFSIKPDGRIIERNEFRINTPGELREITFKGIEAKANKLSRMRPKKWR